MTALRVAAGVTFAALLALLSCDAFGLSRIDDRRAAERHELLHPGESGLIVVHSPRVTATGPGSVGMIGSDAALVPVSDR